MAAMVVGTTAEFIEPLVPVGGGGGPRLNGTKSLVVVIVGFADRVSGVVWPACDEACVGAVLWGGPGIRKSVSATYAASSFQTLFLAKPPASAVVRAAIPIDLNQPTCGMADAWAEAATAAAPVNISAFTIRVFLYPQAAGAGTCLAGGYSNVGCTPRECSSWLRGFSGNLVVHELGHLVGLGHAAFDVNGDGVIRGGPPSNEDIADNSDPMTSDAAWRGFGVPHRMRALWMPCQGGLLNMTTATLGSLSRASHPSDATIALCTVDPADSKLLILSLRTSTGVDEDLAPPWTNTVYVHTMKPGGPSVGLARLGPGDTFVYRGLSNVDNVTVTVVAIDTRNHVAELSFVKCAPAAPRVSATLGRAPSTPGYSLVPLTVTLTNRDTLCGNRTLRARVVPDTTTLGADFALGCLNVTMTVTKDNSPAEVYVVLANEDTGETLLATDYDTDAATMVKTVLYCGGVGERLTASFQDKYGDGYCCDFGPGGFSLAVNGRVLKTGGRFRLQDNTTFSGLPVWDAGDLASGASRAVTVNVLMKPGVGPGSALGGVLVVETLAKGNGTVVTDAVSDGVQVTLLQVVSGGGGDGSGTSTRTRTRTSTSIGSQSRTRTGTKTASQLPVTIPSVTRTRTRTRTRQPTTTLTRTRTPTRSRSRSRSQTRKEPR